MDRTIWTEPQCLYKCALYVLNLLGLNSLLLNITSNLFRVGCVIPQESYGRPQTLNTYLTIMCDLCDMLSLCLQLIHNFQPKWKHFSIQLPSDSRKSFVFWKVPRLCPLVMVRAARRWRWVRIIARMILTGKAEVTGEIPVPVPCCPQQTLHGLAWDRSRASADLCWKLT